MNELTPEVEDIGQLNITGNVVPNTWLKTVVDEKGKPNFQAIMILADIVYWYRPTEIRDEQTGMTVGFKRKFKGDLLQRSYKQLAEQFGISKQSATRAVVFLEQIGAVRRVFRTIEKDGVVLNNVLFIKPHVDVISALTYPDCPDYSLPSKMRGGSPQKRGDKYKDFPTETSNSTCNNQTTPEREGQEGRTNERVRARGTEEKPQEPTTPSGDLDKIIEGVHGRLRAAYPDVPLRYQNGRFLEREREIVKEALEGRPPGTSAGEWEADVTKALGNPDFRKWLMANRRGDWCPSLGNVLADGSWERFSAGGCWL